MDDATREFVEGLRECFDDLHDPRVIGRCDHLLLDIIAITVLGVMCGAEDWPDIEQFGQSRHDWLKTFLKLPGGIPSHDTFGRVFGLLKRQEFAEGLFRWTQAIHEATGGKLIAIDGKTLRRSTKNGDRSSFANVNPTSRLTQEEINWTCPRLSPVCLHVPVCLHPLSK